MEDMAVMQEFSFMFDLMTVTNEILELGMRNLVRLQIIKTYINIMYKTLHVS
jgi:hypothetical protein